MITLAALLAILEGKVHDVLDWISDLILSFWPEAGVAVEINQEL